MAKETDKIDIFSPYYINQSRLLDIYAIINGGYSEYSEITSTLNTEKSKKGALEGTFTGGFKVFNFGGSVSGETEASKGQSNACTEKKVQTVTSVLSIVKNTLKQNNYLRNITEAKPGQFICMPVTLSINSVKGLLTEIQDIIKLINDLKKAKIDVGGSLSEINGVDNMLKAIKIVFEGEEILYETDDYAIIANIYDANLYQATRADIIGIELNCLAQVKRIFPDGTQLLKNTIFTKLKDAKAKKEFLDSIKSIANQDNFVDFESVVVTSIDNKPVYQIEIIALYQ